MVTRIIQCQEETRTKNAEYHRHVVGLEYHSMIIRP